MINQNFDPQILHRYLDGTASAEDIEELSAWLRSNADARLEFIEMLNLDSTLAAVSQPFSAEDAAAMTQACEPASMSIDQVTAATESKVAVIGSKDSSTLHRLAWLATAACVAMLLSGVWWSQRTPQPWATVQSRVGAGEFAVGAGLRGEVNQIQVGVVQLVTARGAQIVIEAPATFQFESNNRLRLTRGRLSAEVPPAAKGFTVVTPSGEAIDLGTRFGVDVPTDGPAEIHVFEGEVIAKVSGTKASENLFGGDARALEGGAGAARELRSSAFIQKNEMAELSAGHSSKQRRRAEASIVALRNDPTLIALFDFELNEEVPPGVFRMAQGRWPGSRAPEFVSVGDHVKLDVGGDHQWPQLTLAAWVRLDRLGAPFQSLLHTDGWNETKLGQVHWMVTRHTTMRLALYGNTLAPGSVEPDIFPDSRTPVLPEQGRWIHLATVYDAKARTVRFFLNGEFDKQTRQDIAYPAKLGPSQIGNWNREDRKLSGRIDEFIILGRAMSDKEIQDLYSAGSPYPAMIHKQNRPPQNLAPVKNDE